MDAVAPPPDMVRLSDEILTEQLTTYGPDVYWVVDSSRGSIWHWSPTTKASKLVAKVDGAKLLTAGATDVFWTESGTVRAVKKAGGLVRSVAEERYVSTMAADAHGVYWGAPDVLRSLPAGSATVTDVAKIDAHDALAVEDSGFYVGSAMTLSFVDRGTSQIRRLTHNDTPSDIVTDSDSVYWAINTSLYKTNKVTGLTASVASDFCGRIEALATSGDSVYIACRWISRSRDTGRGYIARVRRSGGCPEAIVSGLDWPRSLVASGGALFYTDSGVVRVVPPR